MYSLEARPWADIEAMYLAIRPGPHRFSEMVRLVRMIADRYDGRLFAATSMHTLLVANTARWDSDHDVLRINLEGERIRFAHHAMPGRRPTWIRFTEADGRAAFEQFERFVAAQRWVVSIPA